MIQGKVKKDYLSEIKEKVSDYDIYKAFCPTSFIINRKFKSPFREDSVPSFIIGNKYGNYYHTDFGNGNFRGDALNFVMQIEKVDFNTALYLIDSKLGLGIKSKLKDWKSTISAYEQPKIVENQVIDIKIVSKPFSQRMHKWWNSYHLSEDYLKDKNVFQVKNLYISRKRVGLDVNELIIAYVTPEGFIKIYRPEVPRKVSKEESFFKWRFKSNIPFDYLFGKENIQNCEKSIIFKSRKDELVGSLLLPCVASVQAENIACFSKETVDYIKNNSKFTHISFGTDEQGKKESNLITKTFNWKHYNTEDKYLPANDFAEVAKLYGLEVLQSHLKLKKII